MRRTYTYVGMTKDKAQRSPSAVLRAASLSSGRWTFYEAVNIPKSSNADHNMNPYQSGNHDVHIVHTYLIGLTHA